MKKASKLAKTLVKDKNRIDEREIERFPFLVSNLILKKKDIISVVFSKKLCDNSITEDTFWQRSAYMNNIDYIVSTENGDILIEKESKRITDDIVDQLIAYRKKLKLTQQDIADATGMKRANIARIELKKNETSLDSLVRYARSMELDLSVELAGMQENTISEKISYGNVYEEIKRLQPRDTLQLLLDAKTEDEKNFYEMIGDFLLQVKQREVVERNLF